MDQIQNGQSPEFLKHLLANPAAANQNQLAQLETLVQTYPQCSIFHMLLAKAAQNSDAEITEKTLQSAAVHTANRDVLFRLIHQPESFASPKPEVIYPPVLSSAETEINTTDTVFTDEKLVSGEEIYPNENTFSENTDAVFTNEKLVSEEVSFTNNVSTENTDSVFTDEKLVSAEISSAENTEENTDAIFIDEKSAENDLISEEKNSDEITPEEAIIAENDLRVEDVNLTFVNEPAAEIVFPAEETIVQHQVETAHLAPEEPASASRPATFSGEIDEEIYDEITAIEDINFEVIKTVSPQQIQPEIEPEKPVEQQPLSVQDKAEKDMLSNIASIDYFTFNNKFGQNQTPAIDAQETASATLETVQQSLPAVRTETDNQAEKESEVVSKYHDEKMPYTFMWWLDKTRKEYAGTYQPYVKNQPSAAAENTGLSVGPELHQQYIESIFHTKPPHNLTESSLPSVAQSPPVKRKEDQLIERFIIEEPHIHPPSNEKLDTENKAKRSSEDADVLVTETLAKIYLDQMLYHKALDTYKKLILKFPEKSRYFTAQIDLIEKKIN